MAADSLKTFTKTLTTDMTSVVDAVPTGRAGVVVYCQASNKSAAGAVTASLELRDASQSGGSFSQVTNVSVPVGASIGMLSGKLVLNAGDTLYARASEADACVLTVSVSYTDNAE